MTICSYVKMMEFEWDETKNQKNVDNRKISFEYVTQVFFDENRIDVLDTRKDYGEQRYITLGSIFSRVFVVAYTIRKNRIRIISARKANERETKKYHKIQIR